MQVFMTLFEIACGGMVRRAGIPLVLALFVWMGGCDESPAPTDAGAVVDAAASDSGAAASDAGPAGSDAGADSGVPTDGGAVDPCAACGAEEACVRGVCLDACAGDLSGWDDALAADLAPVANFCRASSARAVVSGTAGPVVYDLTSSLDGDATVYTISRWTPAVGVSVSPIVVATHRLEPAAAWEGAAPFASGFLAVNPAQTALLFGYTVFVSRPAPEPALLLGELFIVDIEAGTVVSRDAPGNFDAAWVSDSSFVVSAHGLGSASDGNGLYVSERSDPAATRIISGVGPNSGSVVVETDYLLAGGAAADFSSLVFSLARTELDAAITSGTTVDLMVSGATVETSEGATLNSVFNVLRDGRVVTAPWMMPLRTYDATYTATGLSLGPARVLAESIFSGAFMYDTDQLLLVHNDGLLLVAAP